MPGRSPTADRLDRGPDLDADLDPVVVVVTRMLVDVIGPEYLIGLDIGLDTAFDADLELESLEFVALAERLMAHYGEDVDFVGWLATMELDEIIALTVGDLVTFITAATVATAAPAGGR